MSGSYSGVDTFHTSLIVLEDGDDATGVVLSAPDKQVFDNTINLRERIVETESDISALDGRLDTAESDISALDGRLDTAESDITALDGRLDAAESTISATTTALAKQTHPGQLYAGFTGGFTIGASTMVELSAIATYGDSARRATIVDFNSGAVDDVLLRLPMGGVYLIAFAITGAILSTAADATELLVQQSDTDDFASPFTLAHIVVPIVNAAPVVTYAATVVARASIADKYVRFLLPTPATSDITFTGHAGNASVICIGEV